MSTGIDEYQFLSGRIMVVPNVQIHCGAIEQPVQLVLRVNGIVSVFKIYKIR
jgi:hypothetical protein